MMNNPSNKLYWHENNVYYVKGKPPQKLADFVQQYENTKAGQITTSVSS